MYTETTGTTAKVELSKQPMLTLTLNPEFLAPLIKSNMSCHINKPISGDLIDEITQQIIDTINFFINKKPLNVA